MRRRLLERIHPYHRWENQPAQRYRVEDLDLDEVRRTLADVRSPALPWTPADMDHRSKHWRN